MQVTRAGRLRGAAPALALAWAACGSPAPDHKAVVVTPDIPAAVLGSIKQLAAIPLLQGVPPRQGIEVFLPDETPFTLLLPLTATGRFTVDVEAAGATEVALAAGHGEVTIGDATEYDLTVTLQAPTCPQGQGRWCWADPTTWGANLNGVWGSDTGDTWIVGDAGLVLRDSPFSWTRAETGAQSSLRAVWGSGPQDVWAVGDGGTILHYDGKGWTAAQSGTTAALRAVWGSGPGDVWAAGSAGMGVLLHLQGGAWKLEPEAPPPLYGLWGSGHADVWTVGDAGTILRYDGATWKDMSQPTEVRLNGAWGSGPDDVWIAGDGGTVLHYAGGKWSPLSAGTTVSLLAVSGTGPRDVWVVGLGVILHYDGAALRLLSGMPARSLQSVYAGATDEAWAVGVEGTILSWNGTAWQDVLAALRAK